MEGRNLTHGPMRRFRQVGFVLLLVVSFLIAAEPLDGLAVDWNPIGPNDISVNEYLSSGLGDVLCTSTGFLVGFGTEWTEHSIGGLPVVDVAEWTNDTLLVLMGDGSFSDGLYRFPGHVREFDVVEWFYIPTFIHRTLNAWFVGGVQGLYRSDDGRSWEAVEGFSGYTCLAMESSGDNLAVAVTGNIYGVFTSPDDGQTWYVPEMGAPLISSLARMPDGSLYGVTPEGAIESQLWKSTDFGLTWMGQCCTPWMSTLYCSSGCLFVGFGGGELPGGVAFWEPGGRDFISMNDGLPCLYVNRLSENTMIDCWNVVACTDSGAYMTCDFPEVAVEEPPTRPPENVELSAWPNPFNPELTVTLHLSGAATAHVRLFDVLGRCVAVLADRRLEAGTQHFVLQASHLPSGVYFLKADVPGTSSPVRKLVRLR